MTDLAPSPGSTEPSSDAWLTLDTPRRDTSEDDTAYARPSGHGQDDRPVYRLSDVISAVKASRVDPDGGNNAPDQSPEITTSRPSHDRSLAQRDRMYSIVCFPRAVREDLTSLMDQTGSGNVEVALGIKSGLDSVPTEVQPYLALVTQSLPDQDSVDLAPISHCQISAIGLVLKPEVLQRSPDLSTPKEVGAGFVRVLETGDGRTGPLRLMWALPSVYGGGALAPCGSVYQVHLRDATNADQSSSEGPAQTSAATRTDETSPAKP